MKAARIAATLDDCLSELIVVVLKYAIHNAALYRERIVQKDKARKPSVKSNEAWSLFDFQQDGFDEINKENRIAFELKSF